MLSPVGVHLGALGRTGFSSFCDKCQEGLVREPFFAIILVSTSRRPKIQILSHSATRLASETSALQLGIVS